MNKKHLISLLFTLLMATTQAQAAFTLSGTRFIYEEGRKNISFDVNNKSSETYGGQVWIDNISQPDSEVHFTPTPTFFKVPAGQKQIVRIININEQLPKDRESLFWLNVQELPPAPKDDRNVLAIAINTQVKLFWRPQTIINQRDKAEQKIQIQDQVLKNPTPYYFAIVGISINGHPLKLSAEQNKQLAMFAPFSEVSLGQVLNGQIKLEAIDDYGGKREYTLSRVPRT